MNEVALEAVQSDGASLRQHLQIVQRQLGKVPEQLKPVECPSEMLYLWHWFLELDQSRIFYDGRPTALHFAEIESWARLHHITLTRFELKVLKALDRMYIRKVAPA